MYASGMQVPRRELHADWQSDDIVVFKLSRTKTTLNDSAGKSLYSTGSQ